ncbi:MAG TPA: homoserine dehydrogenase [Tepidisphaeraceae bacterium]|jgi:homoserine dehydrogenase
MATQADTSVGIALLGAGVVGRGVLKILDEQADLLRQRTGLTPIVRHVVCRNLDRHADLSGAHNVTADAMTAVTDPKVAIVVEVMGGTGVAGEYTAAALKAGKHVVTANKALLAAHGAELFGLAKAQGVSIGFEASCGGGIPIIDALTRGLVGNRIDGLIGIINGTCNYILTQMTQHGWVYQDALAEAQKIGFAEADPTMDVSGRDTAQKLAILATLAFNEQVSEADIDVTGIEKLKAEDIRNAEQLGYAIKLLAIGERTIGGLDLRVSPTLVHQGDLLADVNGGFNAISVYGHAIGHQFFYGRGAGQSPTASAVVADIIGVAMGTIPHAFERLNVYPGALPPARTLSHDDFVSRFYLRMSVQDQPGVLARITDTLGRHGVSLQGVQQRETHAGISVPIVVTTHETPRRAVAAAVAEIDRQPHVDAGTVVWPIFDRPAEFGE